MIVGATGHQNIPETALPEVRRDIERVLVRRANLIGICSLAAGADQLFASIVLTLGGELHVILPCAQYETTFTSAAARNQFDVMLARASRVETLPHPRPSELAFLEAGRRVVELADVLVAIWDGKEARGLGGTADIVRYARSVKRDVIVLWPTGAVR